MSNRRIEALPGVGSRVIEIAFPILHEQHRGDAVVVDREPQTVGTGVARQLHGHPTVLPVLPASSA